jgi:hypothetical protein
MSAGTVISGGFPGRVAQEVQPNQKCEGCLHYDRQAGRTGACTIGDSPWKCGDGDAPNIGYAPLVRGAGSYLPDMNNHGAHAPEIDPQHVGGLYGSGSTRPVEIRQVSLGEEHVHFVKSFLERHSEMQKSQCLRCSMRGTHGTAPANTDPQACSCKPVSADVVAKALVARLSNADRARVPLDAVTEWVRDVAKAGFRLPATSSQQETRFRKSLSDQIKIDDTGGHLRPNVMKKSSAPAPAVETLSKSYYSEDWIAQFKGTSLFEAARKLCEQELEMEEAELTRRVENLKHEKVREKALKQVQAQSVSPNYDWQEQEAGRTKIRIAKQRLALKLAGLHQDKLAGVLKSLAFKPHPETPKNSVARAAHGEYEISPTSSGRHRLDYYVGSGDHPAHTESFSSHSRAVKHANAHHDKLTAAKAQ